MEHALLSAGLEWAVELLIADRYDGADYPGQADVVRRYECGLVIPPRDPVAMARAIWALIEDPDKHLQMGHRGYQAIRREHTWDNRAANIHRLLLDALGRDG